ncbi:MAG TPA: divalent cation tolerance protein CutA [Verrucomicrobiae bacterium]|nr:divalent cation tolerance protein CutA [Verrucomicrobiae bacterium]
MKNTYYEVLISAETQGQADKILNLLLSKKLVTGGQFIQAPARFLWKGDVANMDYITISSLTKTDKKDALVNMVELASVEEVPMIRFIPIEVNVKLANWIDATL